MKKLMTICATAAALTAQATTNYAIPWYANPVATNVTYSASLVNDPGDAGIAAKITTAWTAVSGASALSGKTALVKTMGDTTYFRPKFYVLCTSGDIVEFTMAKDLSSAVWTNTLTAAKLAAAAGASGTASDLKVSDDGRLAFLDYNGTWKALAYAAPTWRVITDENTCPCPDKHPVLVDSTGAFVLHFTRPRSWGVPNNKWTYNALSIGTLLKADGSVASYAYDPATETGHYISTASGNGFCPAGTVGEYLDLSSGVASYGSTACNIMANWEFALGVPAGGRTPRVIVHSPNLETLNTIMGGWNGGYEEIVIDSAEIPAGGRARPNTSNDGFYPTAKRIVLNVPITPNVNQCFPYTGTPVAPIASESRWDDFNFSAATDFAQQVFEGFDCGGTLDLPSVAKIGFAAFRTRVQPENDVPVEVRISPENKTVTNIVNQAFFGQSNIWRVVIGGHEEYGVTFTGGAGYPNTFLGATKLREVEFTGGLPLFEAGTGNAVFPSSQSTRSLAFIVPRETKWTNFIEGSYRQATDAEIASYVAANPGRYVPFGVVTDKSLFHAANEQYIAYADSFGKGAPVPFTLRFDETRGSVTTTVAEGNPADALGRYEEGTVLRFTATPNAGVSFRRWYGDIGTNDATAATITVTARKNLFLAARFANSWTIEDYDANTRTAKATDGKFRINLTSMSQSKHTFTLGDAGSGGLFDISTTDNGDGTVTTNMPAGSSTLDLGGEFRLAGDDTPWVPAAFYNQSYLCAYPIAYVDTVKTFFSPGTIATAVAKPLFGVYSQEKTLLTAFETVVLDEPQMPGKLVGSTFSGSDRKVKNLVLLLPCITNIEEKAFWSAEPANDFSTWDLSSVATISPIGLTTQWYLSNENSYSVGRRAFDCYGDLALPALRSVDAGVWTNKNDGLGYRAVSLSPMPYMTSLTLGGKTKADTVTNLCDGAFAGNSAMTNLTICADENIVVGTGIFADHAGRDTANNKDVVYSGHTPETITFTGKAPNSDIFANLLAGVGAGDAPVLVRVTSHNTSWFRRNFIDYRPTAAETALADGGIAAGEKVFGVYRVSGTVKGVFVCDENLDANLATTVIFR